MTTPATITDDDVSNAFDGVASGEMVEAAAFIDRRDGSVHYTSGEDAEPRGDFDADDFLPVPDKRELDLGRELVFDFVQDTLPDDFDEVRAMFRRRGAYGRFRDLVERRGCQQQ